MYPDQYAKFTGWPTFSENFRRVSGWLHSLSRIGVGRLVYLTAVGELPSNARSEERAFWSAARHYRSLRDEFSELRTALPEAGEIESLGGKPLIVVTAGKDAADGWQPL